MPIAGGVFLIVFAAVMFGIKMNSKSGRALAARDIVALLGVGICFGAGVIVTLYTWRT